VALAVVSRISVDDDETEASGGAITIFEPWMISDGDAGEQEG
jgi:hypothetical protein